MAIFCTKITWRGNNNFSHKILKLVFLYNHSKSSKMSSKTYMYVRANHHVQVKNILILHKMKICDHGLSLLLMQNSYSKLILAVKMLSADRFTRFLQVLFPQIVIFFLPSNNQKILSLNSLSYVRFYTLNSNCGSIIIGQNV